MIESRDRSLIVNTTNLSGNFPEKGVCIWAKAIEDTFIALDDSI